MVHEIGNVVNGTDRKEDVFCVAVTIVYNEEVELKIEENSKFVSIPRHSNLINTENVEFSGNVAVLCDEKPKETVGDNIFK